MSQQAGFTEAKLRERIADLCRSELDMPGLEMEQDFFDHGANSLTIVALQIQLEKALNLSVPTSNLMLDSSIAGWTRAYAAAAEAGKGAALAG